MSDRLLHAIARVLHPQPPCSIGDLSCGCGRCFELRRERILERCEALYRTSWAFQPAENDDGRITPSGWAVLLMRASLFDGEAPEKVVYAYGDEPLVERRGVPAESGERVRETLPSQTFATQKRSA